MITDINLNMLAQLLFACRLIKNASLLSKNELREQFGNIPKRGKNQETKGKEDVFYIRYLLREKKKWEKEHINKETSLLVSGWCTRNAFLRMLKRLPHENGL
jgi:hypothetical protein